MLRKTDKLVLQSFFGLFFLTFSVVLFILLMVFMSRYFDDMIGKDLGVTVLARLFFYFTLTLIPQALPLAILLSSLMAFGNLGEHNELTALKSLGIPLTRLLIPIGIFAVIISVSAFFFNNYAIPEINLKAYQLLYDVKKKKPALDFTEGIFYNGLKGWSIRIDKKTGKNGRDLEGVMIYDHRKNNGQYHLIVAETGRMETIMDDTYLLFDLQDGMRFQDGGLGARGSRGNAFVREQFDSAKFLFSLAEFGFEETPAEQFEDNRAMMNVKRLKKLQDSLKAKVDTVEHHTYRTALGYFNYQTKLKRDSASVVGRRDLLKTFPGKLPDTLPQYDTWPVGREKVLYDKALSKARSFKNVFNSAAGRNKNYAKEGRRAIFDMHYKYTLAVACFIMFVIGAPLGAIIKKGGLGLPVLVSVFFYIIQYVMNITGKKWSREALVPVEFGAWYGMVILLAVGVFFFIQARSDSRVFEKDVYLVQWYRLKKWTLSKFGREKGE